MMRQSRDNYDINLEKSNKKLLAFSKEIKKMLLSDETKSSKKYQQFLNKYRFCSKEEADELKGKFNKSMRSQGGLPRGSMAPLAIENKV